MGYSCFPTVPPQARLTYTLGGGARVRHEAQLLRLRKFTHLLTRYREQHQIDLFAKYPPP